MIKEVRYNGYAANPSEYQSADGDLGVAMNLVPEDGGLKLMEGGKEAHQWSKGMSALYIHRSSQYKHIIYTDGSIVYWAEMSETDNSFEEVAGNKVIGLAEGEEVRGIVAIGNTLIITTSESMRYVLWRDEKYIDLGSKLPFVGIEFDMKKVLDNVRVDEDEFTDTPRLLGKRILESVNGSGSISGIEDTRDNVSAFLKKITDAVYGSILNIVSQTIESQGYFYQPMMVRYAIKMYDGEYVMHSTPVLMIPTVCAPSVKVNSAEGNGSTLKTNSTTTIASYALQYRIVGAVPDYKQWGDLIQSIDIFVSAPIYTWNQSEDIKTGVSHLPCLSRALYTSNREGSDAPDDIFAGHSDGLDYTTPYRGDGNFWNVALNDKWEKDVISEHIYYLIATIPIERVKQMEAFADVELENKDLTALETLPTLDDDYNSHSKLVGGFQYAYNNRLNLANVEYFAGDTLPIRTMGAYVEPADGVNYVPLTIDVWIKKEGKEIVATQTIKAEASESNPFAWANVAKSGATFPRWMYYPDAGAYKMRVRGDGWNKTFYLTPHDFLNGAYWWGGLDLDVEFGELPIVPMGEIKATSVQMGNKLYTSEAENPWVFPASGVRAIGDGDIIGIASAARALSEGQFGQFPLYAFTTEGVWALSVNDTGTFNPAQPISRDVCVDADSITQIDQSVLFATNRGVMMIAGSETICMTDGIDTDSPMLLSMMPGGLQLMAKAEIGSRAFDMVAFKDYLQGARMVYDYTHQRIVLYQPRCDYAYVYSLKSKQWGVMESEIQYSVNSYPEALVVTSDNKLVDLSSAEGELMRKGLMVTRALKLDGGDILKTIDTIIQRGDFDRGDVSTVLWGSRDLKHWHLIWTSKDHYLRGFRGSPYKYYRIGAIAEIGKEESLIGASINYQLKQTDKLR